MVTRATTSPNPRSVAFVRAGGLAAGVLILDQITKRTIAAGIVPGSQRKLIPGVELVHARNSGVAFSLLTGGGTVVVVFTVIALAVLAGYFALRPDRPLLWLPTGLLVGGALGNLLDRITTGAVTDFIKLPLWPAFNVADMAVTFGVLALLWVLEVRRGEDR